MAVIIVHGTVRLTPALDALVKRQAEKLVRFTKRLGDGVVIRIELSRLTRHHRKGPVFWSEINCDVPGARQGGFRSEATHEDLRTAFLEASQEMIRQFHKFRGRLSAKYKKGARELKRRTRET